VTVKRSNPAPRPASNTTCAHTPHPPTHPPTNQSHAQDSNLRPELYESSALPTELAWQTVPLCTSPRIPDRTSTTDPTTNPTTITNPGRQVSACRPPGSSSAALPHGLLPNCRRQDAGSPAPQTPPRQCPARPITHTDYHKNPAPPRRTQSGKSSGSTGSSLANSSTSVLVPASRNTILARVPGPPPPDTSKTFPSPNCG